MTNQNNEKLNPTLLSGASLAYLGDCVYELFVREYLVRKNCRKPSVESLRYVTAPVQSSVVDRILPVLTEEETDIFRRGKNCVHANIPKASTPSEYRKATGLEALFGWLYLCGRQERLQELFDLAFSESAQEEKSDEAGTESESR